MLIKAWWFFKEAMVALCKLDFSGCWYMLTNLWYLLFKGFAPYDVMDLDIQFLDWFIPRIEYMRKHTVGWPASLKRGDDETRQRFWHRTLQKMENYARDIKRLKEDVSAKNIALRNKRERQFFYLFQKYFDHLWW